MKPLLILVAGPYRSGTEDDPERIAANMRAMDVAALALFKAGHVPIAGEWLALPLIHAAGSSRMGDEVWNSIFHPSAERLAERCDGCLRIGGASVGADAMTRLFERNGRPVWRDLAEVPAP
jgi:GDP-mannose pyrophosphatase NudK